MPQKISSILEPETASIEDRLRAVDRFIAAGYDIHLNFSPVIYYDGWEDDYVELFHLVDELIDFKECVKAEVIFLTHNENKHIYNMNQGLPGEDLLWIPDVQEAKTSEYGGMNIRYRSGLKSDMIAVFKDLHGYIIPWNQIRYIF